MALRRGIKEDMDEMERPAGRRHGEPHKHAVLDAEARRLRRALVWSGPLPRELLAERCATRRWREGSLDEALRHGVSCGALRLLPLGYVAAVTERDR
jgi:hypothetical protein